MTSEFDALIGIPAGVPFSLDAGVVADLASESSTASSTSSSSANAPVARVYRGKRHASSVGQEKKSSSLTAGCGCNFYEVVNLLLSDHVVKCVAGQAIPVEAKPPRAKRLCSAVADKNLRSWRDACREVSGRVQVVRKNSAIYAQVKELFQRNKLTPIDLFAAKLDPVAIDSSSFPDLASLP